MCDSNFWLDLNYLEVAQAAQSCSAHFTALLYTEVYVDKIKATVEESRRCAAFCFFSRPFLIGFCSWNSFNCNQLTSS